MSSRGHQFGRVPTAVIRSGVLSDRTLHGSPAAVALAIAAYTQPDLTATVGADRIAEHTGLSVRQVRRITAGPLAKLFTVEAGGGRGMANRYRWRLNGDTQDVTVSPPKGDMLDVTVSEGKRVTSGAERVTSEALNGDTLDVTPSEGQSIRGGKRTHNSKAQPTLPGIPTPADAVVMTMPTQGGDWSLTQSHLDELAETFPGLDVLQEARKARQWLRDDPRNLKTPGGMRRFLSGWLGRAKPASNGSDPDRRTTSAELDAICPLVEPTDEDFRAAYGDSTP